MGGFQRGMPCTLVAGLIRLLCTFMSSVSGTVGGFQSGEAFTGRRALTIERLVMSGCGQGHKPANKLLKEVVHRVSRAISRQMLKYR